MDTSNLLDLMDRVILVLTIYTLATQKSNHFNISNRNLFKISLL